MPRPLLSLILWVCSVGAVGPVSAQQPSDAEKTAKANLEQLGIGVRVDPRVEKDFGVSIFIAPPAKATNADLKWLKDFARINHLYLGHNIGDEGLKWLKEIPPGRLVALDLMCDKISDAGLKSLKDIPPGLVSLRLVASDKISDEGLRNLKHLKQLEHLDLQGNMLTDRGIKAVAEVMQLRSLRLCVPSITDAGLKELHALSKLARVEIWHCDLSDSALAQFKEAIPGLKAAQAKALNNPQTYLAFQVVKLPRLFKVAPLAVAPQDDAVNRLLKLRFNASLDSISHQYRSIQLGKGLLDVVMLDRLSGMVDVMHELDDFPDRAVVLDGVADIVQRVRSMRESQIKVGIITGEEGEYELLTLELRILKAKQAKGKTQ